MRAIAPRSVARLMDWSLVTRYFVVAVVAHLLFLVGLGRIKLALPTLQLPVVFEPGPGELIPGGIQPGETDPPPGPIGGQAILDILGPGLRPPPPVTKRDPFEGEPSRVPGPITDVFRVTGNDPQATAWRPADPGTINIAGVPDLGKISSGTGTDASAEPGRGVFSERFRIRGNGGNGIGTGGGDEARWRVAPGRTDATERAVTAALRWLQSRQRPDGSWSDGGRAPALSALALLCFFGRAENSDSEFGGTVDKGLRYLVTTVKSDGVVGGMYDQGIVGIALAEAYTLTGSPLLRQPLERVVAAILKAQNVPKLDPTDKGGWRYTHTSTDADLSVAGWQIMALKSAKIASIDVPAEALSNAVDYVWNRHGGPGFAYTGRGTAYGMTGVGVLCQYFLGNGRDQRLAKALDYLAATRVDWEQASQPGATGFTLYSWYYAALALHQGQGSPWRSWNQHFQKALLANQHEDGSWESPSERERDLGHVYSTALCTLMLEVYYRYLPMYRGQP